ncbi:f-box domain-containing protein [Fusarium mundagurra]|uniref:F-box domain-containing protein n=1 Tax=Fusarium mundagurra TaxID=1567541 RepID=A0A8H5YLN2_9HYPO|nr:f-box domain-containing protein [Fusarium mundagurra]
MSAPSLSTLPEELQVQILGYIYKYSLIDLRLVSHTFSRLITPIIFRAIRVRAYRDEPQRFFYIAMSKHLRCHVREVTCDTWTGSCPTDKRQELMDEFFSAIPSICVFPKLDTLNIRLEHDEFHLYHSTQFRLLQMLFDCMEGAWKVHEYVGRDIMSSPKVSSQQAKTGVSLPLKTLAISNLVDVSGLKALLSFQSLVNSGSLKDLRISVADLDASKVVPTTQFIHHELLDTVLSPGIASNLQVLSLFSPASWGWLPNMDFRLVGANDLPNLKVLALGQFEFSQWWQVEWIGSLGIEKLYLDECTVLHSDRNRATISEEETERAKKSAWREGSTYHTHTRWRHIFEHWANTMPNLRVFKIGQGWGLDDSCPWKAIDPTYEGDFYEHVEEDHQAIFQPFRDTFHQHFECPIPYTTGTGIRRYGPEAAQANAAVFPYVEHIKGFQGFGHTYTDSPGHGKDFMNVSSEEKERDRNAFDKFLTVVETRRKGLVGKE